MSFGDKALIKELRDEIARLRLELALLKNPSTTEPPHFLSRDGKRELTDRQQEILIFLCLHIAQHGRPPTRGEIAKHFGFVSSNAAEQHLRSLARKGWIQINRTESGTKGQSRNIKILP